MIRSLFINVKSRDVGSRDARGRGAYALPDFCPAFTSSFFSPLGLVYLNDKSIIVSKQSLKFKPMTVALAFMGLLKCLGKS